MKSLRNLICTVLMTMAMAVAGDGEDLEDRSSTSIPLITAGGVVREEGVGTVYCSDPHCFGCNVSRVLAQSGSFIGVPTSSVQVPLTAAGGAAQPESLNSMLRRIFDQNGEDTMQALDENFEVLVLHLVPFPSVPSVPSADGDAASNGGVSADGAE
jgi:hypothetical protein